MSHSTQKALEPENVCQIAEALMMTHGTTTSLDVKKELRLQGFFAVQAEVSAFMEVLAEARHWKHWSNGRFRIYTFASDTEERMYHYLKKGEQSWEILVDGCYQVIAEGNPGRTFPIMYQEFPSNRHALAHAAGLVIMQEGKGFIQTMPSGLSLRHRYAFREYIKTKPVSCILSFKDGEQTEIFPACFEQEGHSVSGIVVVSKKVGYALNMELLEAQVELAKVTANHSWKVTPQLQQQSLLLGEEMVEQQARLHTGESVSSWESQDVAATPSSTQLTLPTAGIYKAELYYPAGKQLELRHEDWPAETELWPLVLLLLGIVQ